MAPAAPGGLYSLFARLIGSKLEQRLGKPFIVENRPGASSIVGAMSVIRGPHDGYTLMVGNTSGLATNVSLHKSLPYDPVKDFAPIALIARIPEVLVVNAALPVHSLRGSRQAREGDARRPDLRLGRRRHRAASQRRAARQRARRRADARALQGHVAGDQRRRRRPHPVHVQPDPVRAAAGAGRQAPHARRDHRRAHRGDPRGAAADRDRAQGVRRGVLVHAGGAGRHAAPTSSRGCTARCGPSSATRRCGRSSPGSASCRCSRRRRTSFRRFIAAEIARWGDIVRKAGLAGSQ